MDSTLQATILELFFDWGVVVSGLFRRRDHLFSVNGFYKEATYHCLKVLFSRESKRHVVHAEISLSIDVEE